jgi:esterase/lipase
MSGKHVIIKTDSYSLKGRLYGKNDGHNKYPAILFLTGWNPGGLTLTPSDFYAGYLAKKHKMICCTIALRGMGSEGDINKLTRADFLKDVISAYDFLSSRHNVDKESITIAGESFGSYMACLLSSMRKVRYLALRVPTDFPDEGFDEKPQIQLAVNLSRDWKIQEHLYMDSYALTALHNFNGSILIVASEHDEYVPLQTTRNYLSSVADPGKAGYYLMKSASHALINPFRQMEYFKVLTRWLLLHLT